MKKITTCLFLSIIIISVACSPRIDTKNSTKYDEVITKYTEIREVISEEVDDTFYVYIRLPKYYDSSNKRYPVLYLLDGDISFNMAISVVRYLQFGKDVPDMILVATGYGTLLNDDETNFRERDYTISEVERFKGSGGGKNYLNFIKNELIPLIDTSYRTNSQRILNGYSLGGLFTINTLLSSPKLFDSYIAGSPYLINDLDLLLEKTKTLAISDLKKKLFISVGEFEDKISYYIPIMSLLTEIKKSTGIELHFSEIKNGTHFTCPPEALAYGLKFVFDQ